VTANTMQADVLTAGTTRTVSYECNQPHPSESAYTRCLRYIVSGGVKSGGEVIVDRVLNGGASATNPVFATSDVDADGRIDYVKVVVEVAARGDLKSGYEHRVVLEDAIYMRNRDG
jgi:hypothetical protein